MTVLTEGRHPGEFLMSEANRQRSRDNITVASGAGIIAPGTVLGKVAASGKYVASAAGATDGSEAAVAVALYGCDATSAEAAIAAIVRDAEVNGSVLTYHADRDQPAEKAAANAALAAVGIIVR
ncbi:MAG: head decoration protein [Pelagibaca sp.]